jgi:hypothetical protein
MPFACADQRRLRDLLTTLAVACAVFASCQFPDYQFTEQLAAGGMTQMAGTGGGGLSGSAAGGATTEAGSGGEDAAGAGGAPPPVCGARPAPKPDSCFDDVQGVGETDVDCGGPDCQPCFAGACAVDADCLVGTCAGSCATPLRLEYQVGDPNRTSKSPRFPLKLFNEGAESIPLSTVVLRYYFRLKGVSEPIHVRGGQAIWFQGAVPVDISGDTMWTISRFNDDFEDDFDAYIEISFSVHDLFPGDRVELYQELWGGNDVGSFDQASHYSFEATAFPFQNWPKITAYRAGALVWGYEPRRGGDESCFFRAVNLNGGALTVDGDAWEDSTAAAITASGSPFSEQPENVFPPVQGALAQALATGYELPATTGNVSLPVENGSYLVYVYVVSRAGTDAGTVGIEGSTALDEFQAGPIGTVRAWAKLGPYAVQVGDGALDVSCLSGMLRVSAIELRTPSTASH